MKEVEIVRNAGKSFDLGRIHSLRHPVVQSETVCSSCRQQPMVIPDIHGILTPERPERYNDR